MFGEKKKKEKQLHLLLMCCRIICVAVLGYFLLDGQFQNIGIDETKIISCLVIYVLATMIMNISRVAVYIELILITASIFILQQDFILFLSVFPLIGMMFNDTMSKAEVVIVPVFLGLMGFVLYGINSMTILFVISIIVFFMMKDYESREVHKQMKELVIRNKKSKEIILEMEKDVNELESEMDTLMSMFVRIKVLNEKKSVEELIDELFETPKMLFRAEFVALYLYDGENRYELLEKRGNQKRFDVPKRIPLSDGDTPEIEMEFMRVPIEYEGGRWGVLMIFGKKENLLDTSQFVQVNFEEDDYEKIKMYCRQVMFAFGYLETLHRMEEMANKDFLTKIPNRRRFIEEATMLMYRAKRGEQLALAILDIDYFKKFNDKYGHDKGDEVLIKVAEVLEESVRESDFVGRLGGEEFAVLIPNADEKAVDIMERVRINISKIDFVEEINVSVGIAFYGRNGTHFERLNKKADEALYRAKENGRNQVVVAEIEE